MTPKDKLAEALCALDAARRALEQLRAIDTGDAAIDDCIDSAVDTVEAEIAAASLLQRECV